jgi:hypothetical protein
VALCEEYNQLVCNVYDYEELILNSISEDETEKKNHRQEI